MKRILILMMVMLAAQAQAQTKGGPLRTRTSEQLAQDSREAADKLGAARKSGEVEQGRISATHADGDTMAGKAKKAASDLLRVPDAAELVTSKNAEKSMAAAIKNVTAEGRALIEKSESRGPSTAPPHPEGTPKPVPLTPTSLENPADPGNRVTINSDASYFDSETAIMLFTGNVRVRHPQLFVTCDEFEVHMIKDEKPKEGEAPKPEDAVKDPVTNPVKPANPAGGVSAGTGPESGSSIKFAIARGRMVKIEKLTETGEIQVGYAKHATYEGATGNVLLRDFPQVQRGPNLQIATDPSTTMLLKQSGALETKGPARTEIIQDGKAKGDSPLISPPPPEPSPNPNSSPTQPRQ